MRFKVFILHHDIASEIIIMVFGKLVSETGNQKCLRKCEVDALYN